MSGGGGVYIWSCGIGEWGLVPAMLPVPLRLQSQIARVAAAAAASSRSSGGLSNHQMGTITKPTHGLFLMAAAHPPPRCHRRDFCYSSNFINNYCCSRTTTAAKAMTPPLNSYSKENDDEEEEVTSRKLRKGIAEFYDESSGLWESIWGDHMHHGFYDTTNTTYSLSDHRSAQFRMVEESLRFAQVSEDPLKRPKRIVDVGCGVGGSSRYLAKKYDAECQGITLSAVQAQRAQALAAAQGLADKVSFQVADALNQPFLDGQFDLVWSMESGEHMPNKSKFVNELARVAAPGGTIIIVTWCHRDLSPSEKSLRPSERDLLKKICDAYYLPAWCSAADYVELLKSLSLQDVRRDDWTEYVAPFWPAVISTALTWKGFTSLMRSGWKTIKGALVMPLMIQGYNKGLIKFAIITCRKPQPYLH